MSCISIIVGITLVSVAIALVYFKCEGDVYAMALELIGVAEQLDTTGENKMGYVVDEIYKRLPPVVKGLVRDDTIKRLAQAAFDGMKAYFEAKTGAATEEETFDKIAIIVNYLADCTFDDLRDHAMNVGINIEDDDSRAELICKIVDHAMRKK